MRSQMTRRVLAGFSLAGAMAFVAACSGPSSSLSPTAPTAASAAAGTSFSPNPGEPPPPPPPHTGTEGCTPGYWKANVRKGGAEWAAAGYAPGQTVGSVFAAGSYDSATLLEALEFGGGPGIAGATQNLLRAGVAALLNAASPGVAYPLSAAQVVASVNAAIASADRSTMLSLAAELDSNNNLGCPLDNSGK